MDRSRIRSSLRGAQFASARCRRDSRGVFIPSASQGTSHPARLETVAVPLLAIEKARSVSIPLNQQSRDNRIHQDKRMRAPSSVARAQLKSKLLTVLAQAAQSVTRFLQLSPSPRFRAVRLASRFRLLPNNASAHREKAKTAHLAIPHWLFAAPPHAKSFERLPALCLSRLASGNRNDKAAPGFVSERT